LMEVQRLVGVLEVLVIEVVIGRLGKELSFLRKQLGQRAARAGRGLGHEIQDRAGLLDLRLRVVEAGGVESHQVADHRSQMPAGICRCERSTPTNWLPGSPYAIGIKLPPPAQPSSSTRQRSGDVAAKERRRAAAHRQSGCVEKSGLLS